MSPAVALSLALASALSGAASRADGQPIPGDFEVVLERTHCFGECPVYRVSIDARGVVTYDGRRFVRVEGRQSAQVPASDVAGLLDMARRIGFFELRDQYRSIRHADGTETVVTDLPTTFVTVSVGGRSKRVEHYFGGPASLKQFEDHIDKVAGVIRWIRIDKPTLQRLLRDGWTPSREQRLTLLADALRHDDIGAIEGLLESGTDPDARIGDSETRPLMLVQSVEAARLLLAAGADPFARTSGGNTAMGQAVRCAPGVAGLLLAAGVPVNDPIDADGRTALWQAACTGNIGVVRLLLEAGGDPRVTVNGLSPIECARREAPIHRRPEVEALSSPRRFTRDFDQVIDVLAQHGTAPRR